MMKKVLWISLFISFYFGEQFVYGQDQIDSLLSYTALSRQKVYSSLEEALKEPEKVLVLDLGDQKLEILSSEIGQLIHLQKLTLYGNKLKVLPAEIGNLKNLQWLDLYYNKLEELPDEFRNLKNLYYLDLGTNHFKEIPSEVYALSGLRHFYIYGNKIKTIPAEITTLNRLEYLRAGKGLKFLTGGNRIRKLPDNFGELSNLKELHLPDNCLRKLPSSFSKLQNLTWLEINHNRFKKIPSVLDSMPRLQYVSIWDRGFSEEEKTRVKRALPKTNISYHQDYEGNFWGVMAGLQQGNYTLAEVGIARAFKKDIVLLAVGASGEFNLNKNTTGIKLSAWANGLSIFSLGFHGIYYIEKEQNYFAVRPEFGIGMGVVSLNYGYNILYRKGSTGINKHLVSLRVLLPFSPLFFK